MTTATRGYAGTTTSVGRGRAMLSVLALVVAGIVVQWPTASQALAAVLYVDGAGACSDAGTGTAAVPYCTISKAAAVAAAGQTVQVATGSYTGESVVGKSGTAGAPIVFQPAPGAIVTVGGAAHAFSMSARSYVQVRGFHVADTTDDGISVKSSNNIVVADNEVTGSGSPNSTDKSVGIYLESTTSSVISNNRTHHNSDRGIYLNLSNGNTVADNASYANAREYEREASGIHVYRSNSNILIGNHTYGNEDSGINLYQTSSNNLVVNNITHDNGDHGIDISQSTTGNRLIGNTVYRNVTAGMNAEGGSTGTIMANNISVDNGIGSPRTHGNVRVDSTSVSGSSINFDVLYLSKADVMGIWNNVNYTTLAALRTATGQETRGIQADPGWRSPGTGDFHLTTGSPAIDSANADASGQTNSDFEGTARVDDLATANTGAGVRLYDDRGALEFVPGSTVNNPPHAVDDAATTGQDTPVTVKVLLNDTDPDGDVLRIASANVPTNGSLAINSNGTISYTPSPGYTGPDQFTYTASDGRGGTDSAAVAITVAAGGGSNQAPVAGDDTATTQAGSPVTVNVLANDTDADADPLSVTSATPPAHGTAAVNPSGSITYTPTAGYTGSDTYEYTVSDGRGGTDTGAVTLTVTPSSTPAPGPNLVSNPGFETNTNGWNTSGSGAGVTLSRVTGGHSGSWSGRVTNTNSNRRNCFLNDVTNTVSSTATGTYTTSMWVRSDTAGSVLTLRLQELAGSTVTATKTATRTLTTGWQLVSLTHTPTVTGRSLDLNAFTNNTATGTCFYADDISLTLTPAAVPPPPPPPNRAPVATDDSVTASQDTAVAINVLANDTDADNETLTVTATTPPLHGTAAVGTNGNVVYTPGAGYSGLDQFDYTVADRRGGTDTGTVFVTVNAVVPPRDPNFVGNPGFEDGTSGWNTSGGDAGVTLARVAGGHSGDWSAQLTNTNAAASNCTLNDAPNWVNGTSAATYTSTLWARADTAGATLRVRVREFADGAAVGSQVTTATLTTEWQKVTVVYVPSTIGSTLDLNAYEVGTPPGACFYVDDITMLESPDLPANQAPDAVDDTASTQQDSPVTVNVLANDTDADGDTLTVRSLGAPGHGAATASSTGAVTYTPAAGYAGPDSFTYTVRDGRGGTDTATVVITVKAPEVNPNLVGNSDFETGLSGWNTSGGTTGVTLQRVAGGHSGGWSAQLSNPGAAGANCTLNDAPNWVASSTPGTYVATIWVRSDTAGTSFKLRIREYNAGTFVNQGLTTLPLTTEWQQVTVAYTVGTGGTTLDLNAYSTTTPTGACFYADDVTLTKG